MQKIKNILLYGGLDKDTYIKVYKRACYDNRRMVTLFTILTSIAFIFVAVMAIINNLKMNIKTNTIVYFVGIAVFILILVLNELLYKKLPTISNFFAIFFSALVLVVGTVIAYSQKEDRTTMLLPLFIIASLVFCYRPIYLICMFSSIEVAYIILMYSVQSSDPSLFFINAVNTIIFCIMGIVSGFFTICLKYKKYAADYQNDFLIERDTLTGLYNRFSWQKALEKIVVKQEPVYICSFDVNGLKKANDTLGHLAGDELIIGAANCINDVFGKYGNVYRVGGDEFCALSHGDFDPEVVVKEFREKTNAWHGVKVESLNIAVGIALLDHDYENILASVVHEADKKMYAEKQEYYQSNKF